MSPLSELYQNTQISTALHSEAVVQGMIFGVCAAPEIPMPEQWMPWTFAQHQQLTDEVQKTFLSPTHRIAYPFAISVLALYSQTRTLKHAHMCS